MKQALFLSIILLTAFGVSAQIETDRPDFTESPNVVPKKSIQLETGIAYGHSFDQTGCQDLNTSNITLNTGLIRYGIGAKTELRLNWNVGQVITLGDQGGTGNLPCPQGGGSFVSELSTGLSPIFIGIKRNLHASEHISIGLLAHLYLPFTGTNGFEADRFAPEFLLPVAIAVSDRFSVAFQLGMSWDGNSVEPEGSYTLSMAYSISDRLGAYLEPYGYKNQTHGFGSRDGRINGGFTYLLNDNFQLDISSGIHKGPTDAWTDYFVGCGFSYIYHR